MSKMNEISEEREQQHKVLALIICLFIGVLYVETVWEPYFYGTRRVQPAGDAQQAAAGQGAGQGADKSTANTQAAVNTLPGQNANNNQTGLGALAHAGKPLSTAQIRSAGIVRIKTKEAVIEISQLGGRIVSYSLNHFELDYEHTEQQLNMVSHSEDAPYPLGLYSGSWNDQEVVYRIEAGGAAAVSKGGAAEFDLTNSTENTKLVLLGVLPDGREVRKQFTFFPDGYVFDVTARLGSVDGQPTGSADLQLEWVEFVGDTDTSLIDPYDVKGFTWFDDQKAMREPFNEIKTEKTAVGAVRWVSLGSKYFAASMLSKGDLRQGSVLKSGDIYKARVSGSPREIALSMVVGPKSYPYLESLNYGLERNIDFGVFGIVGAPLLSLLRFLSKVLGNWGLAIVLLTIGVKLALYPLNATSFRQMKAMQDLRPEVERLKKEVKDKQQQQMEMMALYKKKGVNPLGGCLPVLLQMPIFIGLYSALRLAVELRGAPFALWIHDLSAPEKLSLFGINIPVLVVLFALAMLVQQWTTPTAMDPAQKKVMMFMPVFMAFIFAGLPAGLTLYMLTNCLISIGQQKGMHADGGGREAVGRSAFQVTAVVSVSVFVVAFIVTLF